jgi:hypothetical protein
METIRQHIVNDTFDQFAKDEIDTPMYKE